MLVTAVGTPVAKNQQKRRIKQGQVEQFSSRCSPPLLCATLAVPAAFPSLLGVLLRAGLQD